MEEMTPKMAVELAIAVEEMGGRFYAHLAKKLEQDRELRELFARLAADEREHQQQFAALLSALSGGGKPTLNEEHQAYRRAEALNEFFGAKGGPFARRDDIRTPRDALHKALELERMTLAYYQALREVLGHSDAIEALIAAETRHVENVTRALEAASQR
jgi:rubrerythrin